MLNEVNDIAGQHEIISETLTGQIMKEILDLVKELKEERKKVCISKYFYCIHNFFLILPLLVYNHY